MNDRLCVAHPEICSTPSCSYPHTKALCKACGHRVEHHDHPDCWECSNAGTVCPLEGATMGTVNQVEWDDPRGVARALADHHGHTLDLDVAYADGTGSVLACTDCGDQILWTVKK